MKRSFFFQPVALLLLLCGCHRSLQVGETIYIYPDAGPDALGADVSVDGPTNFDAPPDGGQSHQFGPLIVGEARPLNDSSDPGTFVFGTPNFYEAAVGLQFFAAAELGNARLVTWVQRAQGRDTLWSLRSDGTTSNRWMLDARIDSGVAPEVMVTDNGFVVTWQHQNGWRYFQPIPATGDFSPNPETIPVSGGFRSTSNFAGYRGGLYFGQSGAVQGVRQRDEGGYWNSWPRHANAISGRGHLHGTADRLYLVHEDGIATLTGTDEREVMVDARLADTWRNRLRAAYPVQDGFVLTLLGDAGLIGGFGRIQNGQLLVENVSPLRWRHEEPVVFVERNGSIALHPCEDEFCTKPSATELAVWTSSGTFNSQCERTLGACRIGAVQLLPGQQTLVVGSVARTLGLQCQTSSSYRSDCSIGVFDLDQVELLVGPERSHAVPRLFGHGEHVWAAYYSNEDELRMRPLSGAGREFSLGPHTLHRIDDSQEPPVFSAIRRTPDTRGSELAQLMSINAEAGSTTIAATPQTRGTWFPCGIHRLFSESIHASGLTSSPGSQRTVRTSDGRQLSFTLGWAQQFIESDDQCYLVRFAADQGRVTPDFFRVDDAGTQLVLTPLATGPSLRASYANDMVAIPNGIAMLLPSAGSLGGAELVVFQTGGAPVLRTIRRDDLTLLHDGYSSSFSLARESAAANSQHLACDGVSLVLIERQLDRVRLIRLDFEGNEIGRAEFTLSATPEVDNLSYREAPLGWQAVHGTEPGRFIVAYQQFSREHQAYRIYLRDITALDMIIR